MRRLPPPSHQPSRELPQPSPHRPVGSAPRSRSQRSAAVAASWEPLPEGTRRRREASWQNRWSVLDGRIPPYDARYDAHCPYTTLPAYRQHAARSLALQRQQAAEAQRAAVANRIAALEARRRGGAAGRGRPGSACLPSTHHAAGTRSPTACASFLSSSPSATLGAPSSYLHGGASGGGPSSSYLHGGASGGGPSSSYLHGGGSGLGAGSSGSVGVGGPRAGAWPGPSGAQPYVLDEGLASRPSSALPHHRAAPPPGGPSAARLSGVQLTEEARRAITAREFVLQQLRLCLEAMAAVLAAAREGAPSPAPAAEPAPPAGAPRPDEPAARQPAAAAADGGPGEAPAPSAAPAAAAQAAASSGASGTGAPAADAAAGFAELRAEFIGLLADLRTAGQRVMSCVTRWRRHRSPQPATLMGEPFRVLLDVSRGSRAAMVLAERAGEGCVEVSYTSKMLGDTYFLGLGGPSDVMLLRTFGERPPRRADLTPPSALTQLPPPLLVSDLSLALLDDSARPSAQHAPEELAQLWAAEALLFAEAAAASARLPDASAKPPDASAKLPDALSIVPDEALVVAAHAALFVPAEQRGLTAQLARLRTAWRILHGEPDVAALRIQRLVRLKRAARAARARADAERRARARLAQWGLGDGARGAAGGRAAPAGGATAGTAEGAPAPAGPSAAAAAKGRRAGRHSSLADSAARRAPSDRADAGAARRQRPRSASAIGAVGRRRGDSLAEPGGGGAVRAARQRSQSIDERSQRAESLETDERAGADASSSPSGSETEDTSFGGTEVSGANFFTNFDEMDEFDELESIAESEARQELDAEESLVHLHAIDQGLLALDANFASWAPKRDLAAVAGAAAGRRRAGA